MPFYSPRKTVSSYNKESVYGTAPGSLPKYLGGMNPIDRALSNRLVKREGIRDSAETEGFVRGYKDIKFNITLTKWLRADVFEYVFGQQSESGPVSGVYTHILTVLNNPLHPSMALEIAEKGTTNSVAKLTGVMLDGMTLRWQQGQPLSLILPIIAQDATTGTTILGTATPSNEVQYLGKHLTIRIDGVIVPTNSGEFVVKKGLLAEPKPDAATGDKIAQPKLGEVEYQLDLVFDKQGETGFNAWDDASPHDIEIDIDRGTNDFIHIALNDMYVDDLKHPIDLGNNVNIETLTLRGGSITVTVKDDHAW